MRVPFFWAIAACMSVAAQAQPVNLACLPEAQRNEAQSRAQTIFEDYARKRSATRAAAIRQAEEERARKRDAMFDCDAAAHKAGVSAGERCAGEMVAFREAQRTFDNATAAAASAVDALNTEEAAQLRQLRSLYPSC